MTKPRWMGKGARKRVRYSNNKSVKQWLKNGENFENACIEKKNGKEGHVYVFRISGDLYKIGRTYDIAKRLKALRAGNPDIKCVWSAWSRDCFELEKRIHVSMQAFHEDREFFRFHEGVIRNINEVAIGFNKRYE